MRVRPPAMVFLIASFLTTPLAAQSGNRTGPPPTQKGDVKETLHGVEIADPYRWLEDQQSPETRAWIDEQNRYSSAFLSALPGRDALKKRISDLLKVDIIGTPTVRGGRYFFSKRLADQDLSVLYVRRSPKGPDEVLVDPHPMNPSHTTSVNFLDVTEDGKLAAYGIRQGGEDEQTVKFLEVDSRKELADSLPRARYSGVAVKPDKTGVYFSRHTPEGPRVYYHAMGSNPRKDIKLFGDGYGPEKIIVSSLSDDGRYLVIVVLHGAAATKTEIYVEDVAAGGPILPIVRDVEARFNPEIAGDRLYLETNWNAPRGRILAVDIKHPEKEKWKEVVAEGAAVIENYSAVGGKLFVNYLENVVSRVKVFDAEGKPEREITFPTLGSVGGMRGTWKDREAFFTFTSYVVPTTVYRYDVATGAQSVWARPNVPVDSDRFEVRQVKYASKDGTQIPMFVVSKKGIRQDGTNPTLLTGYGGFTLSLTPTFSARAVLWTENGGVFAVPNLRGGGEFGEDWHRAGMLAK
jgi:prolyl oligopeptidase